MTDLTVIILTQDEARHIARAIASVKGIAARVIVVDSGSSDQTVILAKKAGAEVLHHPWINHAAQFNWALDQVGGCDWIMRLDADEVVTESLADAIKAGLPDVQGIYVNRQIRFMGQPVRFGGVNPVQTLRLFRHGFAQCEARWMDEHIVVNGLTARLHGAIIDDNENPLDWWIAKHNAYASREVIDMLARRSGLWGKPDVAEASTKRWLKENVYQRLPGGLRAGLYFTYRYVVRFGFLDGRQARAFHVLQGFWYRYLVDAKLAEVERFMARTGCTPLVAIEQVLGVTLPPERRFVA